MRCIDMIHNITQCIQCIQCIVFICYSFPEMSSLGELVFERSEEVSEETGGIVKDSEEMLEAERTGGVVEESEEMLEAEERTGEVVADSEEIGGAAEPETDAITEERRGSEEVVDEEVEEEVEEDSAGMEAGNNSAVPEVLDNRTNTDFPATRHPAAEKLFRFPQGRIKQIMKLDPEVGMVNQEAIFLVNRATEQFIQCLAEEAFHHTNASKKKTIMIEHVNTAIESVDELAFLDGAMED